MTCRPRWGFGAMLDILIRANLLRILETCQEFNVPCATGANTPEEVAMRMEQGFRIIITAPVKSTPGLNEGHRLAGR